MYRVLRPLFYAVIAPIGLAGCMPVIAHGPKVRLGSSLGVVTTFEYRSVGADRAESLLVPNFGFNWTYGWSGTPNRGGFLMGVHLPLHPWLTQADLYYQLPAARTRSYSASVGVSGSMFHVMPYFQAGRIGPNGAGWYTTQGLALKRDNGYHVGEGPLSSNVILAWMPTIAYQEQRRYGETHWYLNGALGTFTQDEFVRGARWWALNAGFLVLFRRGD